MFSLLGLMLVLVVMCAPTYTALHEDNAPSPTDMFVQESLVRAHQGLTTRLYKVFARRGNGNLLISPWSVMSLLAVTYMVAGGKTASEIGSHLRINLLRRKEILAGFHHMNNIFANTENGSYTVLESVNGAFVGKNVSVRPKQSLQKILKEQLNAYIDSMNDNNVVDGGDSKAMVTHRNQMMEKTNGLIRNLLPWEDDSADSRSLWFFNIMYFQGTWKTPFNPRWTRNAKFMVEGKHSVMVPVMNSMDAYPRSRYPELGMQLLELPYGQSGRFGLFILLPDEADGLPKLEERLKQFSLENMLSEKHAVRAASVRLPKFKFQTDENLTSVMKKLGFRRMFSPREADFSRLNPTKKNGRGRGQKSPYVSRMVQKSVIEVSENGTSVAAVTSMMMSARRYVEPFHVVHPFMFVLRDKKLGINLFVGRVTDPRSLPT